MRLLQKSCVSTFPKRGKRHRADREQRRQYVGFAFLKQVAKSCRTQLLTFGKDDHGQSLSLKVSSGIPMDIYNHTGGQLSPHHAKYRMRLHGIRSELYATCLPQSRNLIRALPRI